MELSLALTSGHLIWLSFCLTSLLLQGRIMWRSIQAKPMLHFGLNDHVASDLVVFYCANFAVAVVVNVCLVLDLAVPTIPAFALAHLMEIFGSTFAIYMSLGICLQYAHARLKASRIQGLFLPQLLITLRSEPGC